MENFNFIRFCFNSQFFSALVFFDFFIAQLFAAIVRKKQQGCEMVIEEARLISPAKARNYLSQHSLRPDTLDVEALETPTDAATAALMAEREERMTRPALAGMRLLRLGLLPPGKHRLHLRHPPFAGKGM